MLNLFLVVRRTFSTSFGLLPLQNNFSFKYLVAGSNLFGSIDSITASKRHWYDSVSCEPFTSSSCMKIQDLSVLLAPDKNCTKTSLKICVVCMDLEMGATIES